MLKWLSGKAAVKMFLILLVTMLAAACSTSTVSNSPAPSNPPAGSGAGGGSPNEGARPADNRVLSIGTLPIGGSYHAVGSGLASVISTNSSLQVSVKPFAGFPAWGPLLDKGELEMGVVSAQDTVWALKGENGFPTMKNVRMMVRGNFIDTTGLVVRADSDIKSNADLKGKRISSDYPGTMTGKMSVEATLAANGLTWDDVTPVPVPTTIAGIEALRDNRLDAAYALTPNTPIMVEVHNAIGLRVLPFIDNTDPKDIDNISPDVVETVREYIPGAQMVVVKPSGFITEESIGFAYPTLLVASAHLDDESVYEMMKTIWEHHEKLHSVHPWLQAYTPDNMFDPEPVVPYHPGAVKFFKEIGLWNDSVEKIQQDLLKIAS